MYLNNGSKWADIKAKVVTGIKSIFPIEGKTGRIECLSVDIPDKKAATIDAQKSTLLNSSSLETPVYATLRLTRGAKSEEAKIKILDLPILTERGTFIVLGKDYSVFNQVRLLPGVYTRRTADSNDVYSDFNLGKGLGFEIHMDTSGVFSLKFDKSALSTSSSKIPLYPLLKALGADDSKIASYWSEDLVKINREHSNGDADLKKIVERVIYPTKRSGDNVKDLKDYFATNVLNENTTAVTLGTPMSGVTADTLLKASQKLLKVYNNEQDEDDLDSLLFKEVLSVDDHLMLRIEKKFREEGMLYKVQAKIDQGLPLRNIILPNMLTKLVEGFFTKSTLSSPQTEINPIEILETNHKITAMGEGGIGNERAIPMSARNLHPSHLSYLDPVRTAESTRVGVDLRTTINTTIHDRNVYTEFFDNKGNRVQLKPIDLLHKYIGFAKQEGKDPVKAMYDGDLKEVPRSQVDYWMTAPSNMFTVTTNLVPFLHNDQGNRVTMAGRMVTQAVPLVHREAPLVQIKDQSGMYGTLQEHYGKEFFVPKAPEDGVVTEVTSKYIKVNRTKIDIYDNFPLNLKCPSGEMKINIKHEDGTLWRGKIKDYVFTEGDRIHSVNEWNKSGWQRIKAFDYQDNDKELLYIKFRSGRGVVVTEDHSLITLDQNGKLVPIFPKDCKPGTTKCPVSMLKYISKEDTTTKYDSRYYGIVAGLYLSNGYIRGNQVYIACGPQHYKEVAFALSMVSTNEVATYDNCVKVTDADLRNWLVDNFKRYSDKKEISRSIFTYSTEFKQALIAGYMAGDGTLAEHDKVPKSDKSHFQVGGSTASEALRDDLVDILSSLNIFCTIGKKRLSRKDPNWKDAYTFNIPVRELPDWELFFYKDRQVYLEKLISKLSDSTVQRFKLTKPILAAIPADAARSWEKSDIRWDTIVSITTAPHEKYVYDFEVDKTNMFAVQSGLIIHNTFLTMYPLVKVGDKVKKGDILADSNFTKNGELALGTNLNVAYIPYKGWTHEDSIVISESTAEKLTSQHMYIKEFELTPDSVVDKAGYIKWFPTKITTENIQKLDEQGVVKPGLVVQRGDVLVAGLRRKTATSADAMLKKLRGGLVNPYKDAAETWDHDTPAKVVDVVKQNKRIRVVCTTEDKAKQGDKITGLHGNKGTIGLILPDNEMPVDRNGKPVDACFNPASVPSRVNPGQMYEAMSGKRARLTGKQKVVIDNFDTADSSVKVLSKMKRDGIPVEEPLFDPKTGKKLGDVFVGTPYILKLHKQTEGNFSALYRGPYDVNNQPAKIGGEESAKGVGLLDVYALLGHNARANLAEMATYKSDRNDDFWNRLEAGLTPLPAKEPFVYNKFKSLVTGAGINVKEDDKTTGIMPLTDAAIKSMSRGAIHSSAILENHMGKDRPEAGGIFDPVITGGLKGKSWSHVELAHPVINPLFEGVVSTLLHRDVSTENAKEVQKELAKINVDKRIGEIKAGLAVAKGSNRNKLIKELKYLAAIKKMGISPADYVLTKFPIMPPQFRPVYESQTGGAPMVSDVNYLYKDMLNVNKKLEEMKDYPDKEKEALIKDLRQSAHAIVGTMAPINKQNEKRQVSGLMPQLVGSDYTGVGTSKESYFQRKIMKRNQALTGRGTILPNPKMDMDHVGLPEELLWTTFEPFIIAALRKKGLNIMRAKDEVRRRSPVAKQLLEQEMQRRPVIMNRAPTLHKYNQMAMKPVAIGGKSIQLSTLVLKGFAADFDGDSVAGDTKVLVQDDTGKVYLKSIKDV